MLEGGEWRICINKNKYICQKDRTDLLLRVMEAIVIRASIYPNIHVYICIHYLYSYNIELLDGKPGRAVCWTRITIAENM